VRELVRADLGASTAARAPYQRQVSYRIDV